jgi:hypothetical protein
MNTLDLGLASVARSGDSSVGNKRPTRPEIKLKNRSQLNGNEDDSCQERRVMDLRTNFDFEKDLRAM